jgi:hypothetical protein
MQEPDGEMREIPEAKVTPEMVLNPKVISTGKYFKIKQCYFRITEITPGGIIAKGVSRKEFYDNR